jgi:hypothetical protein
MGKAAARQGGFVDPMTSEVPSLELFDLLLRAVGAFYAVGALLAGRAVVMDALLDHAIAAISLSPVTAAARRQAWGRLAVAAGFGAGGLLLLIGSVLAAPAFLLSALQQRQRWLTPGKEDPPDDADEPVSSSAVPFVLFLLATSLVLWAAWAERLSPPSTTPPLAFAVIAFVWLGCIVWAVRYVRSLSNGLSRTSEMPKAPAFDQARLAQLVIRVSPAWSHTCLFDHSNAEPILWHEALEIFPADALEPASDLIALTRQLGDPDDPWRRAYRDAAARGAIAEQGRRVVASLEPYFPNRVIFAFPEGPLRLAAFDTLEMTPAPFNYPLFEYGKAGSFRLDPNALGLSWNLTQALQDWAQAFDDKLVCDDDDYQPVWSSHEAAEHADSGRRLAQRVRHELDATERGHVLLKFRPHEGQPEPVRSGPISGQTESPRC